MSRPDLNLARRAGPRALAITVGLAGALAHGPIAAQTALPAASVAELIASSDFGRADILLTAASIQQTGHNIVGLIDQRQDISTTDRALYGVQGGNIAQIIQNGDDLDARIDQIGNLNRARIVQDGSGQIASAFQSGVANSVDIAQTGSGNLAITSQTGNGNLISLSQAGGNLAMLTEVGDRNQIRVQQVVGGAPVSLTLTGNDRVVTIRQ